MDALRKEYADLRQQYTDTLAVATRERDEQKLRVQVERLLDLNQKMSQTAGQMMNVVAQNEAKLDLRELRTHLSDEMVRIQKDVQEIQSGRDRRKMLESLNQAYTVQANRNDWTIWAYVIALLIGLVLVAATVLQSSFSMPVPVPSGIVPETGTLG